MNKHNIPSKTLLSEPCYPRRWDKYLYASYIEFHIDLVRLSKGGTYTIKVSRIHPEMQPNLVHTVNGKFVSTRLTEGGIFTFRANRRHGLFPDEVAEDIIATQSVKPNNKWYKALDTLELLPCIEFVFM
jgi:hypothetical protein